MRTLITGVNGFAGAHLASRLVELGRPAVGLGRGEPSAATRKLVARGLVYRQAALDDAAVLRALLDTEAVNAVVHLAGIRQADSPTQIYETNVLGTSRLLEAVVATGRSIRVVVVGSSAMYGGATDQSPQGEGARVRPVTAYGVSKAGADLMAEQIFLSTGLPILRARPFNIIGPGQRGDFFMAVCAQQLAEIEAGLRSPVLRLGNLDAHRDFLDVRDVVAGMLDILDQGEAGEAYNLCSGVAVRVRSIVDQMIVSTGRDVTVETTQPLAPRTDVPFQVGSFAKLHARTGWRPTVTVDETLRDILEDWRQELGRGAQS